MTSLRREGTGRETTIRERLPTTSNFNVGLRTGIKIDTEGIALDKDGFPELKDFFNRLQMPKNEYFEDTSDESDVETTMLTADISTRTSIANNLIGGRGLCFI